MSRSIQAAGRQHTTRVSRARMLQMVVPLMVALDSLKVMNQYCLEFDDSHR
jgi:hypothetical protein